MASQKEAGNTVIRSRDLLISYLAFQRLTPNRLDWNVTTLADNPPRLIRYQRLVAILAAFGLKTDLATFETGEFINQRDPAYEPLLACIRTELAESMVRSMDRRGASLRGQLRELFETLLKYRLKLQPVLDFTSGTLEADGLYIYALEKAAELNRTIRSHLGIVDDILVELISPTGASFTIDELAKEHGYPLDDLFEIDIAWF